MITASVVLFHTPNEILQKVINSYAPNKERKLFLIDNSQKQYGIAVRICKRICR